jgi:hypothetical protein
MRDLLLHAAGAVAVLGALVHAVIGETRVFTRVHIEPARLSLLIWLVWQAFTLAWIACGVLLFAAPGMGSEPARHWIVAALVPVFAFAAFANAFASRGRHFGWMILGAVVGMAVAGY